MHTLETVILWSCSGQDQSDWNFIFHDGHPGCHGDSEQQLACATQDEMNVPQEMLYQAGEIVIGMALSERLIHVDQVNPYLGQMRPVMSVVSTSGIEPLVDHVEYCW